MDGTVLESDQTYVYVILFNPVSKIPAISMLKLHSLRF